MPKYLLDTNACIALRYHLKGNASKDAARRASDERLITRWKSMAATELAMSLFTLGELRVFVEKHDDPFAEPGTSQKAPDNANVLQYAAETRLKQLQARSKIGIINASTCPWPVSAPARRRLQERDQ